MVETVSKEGLIAGVAAGGVLFDTRPQPKTVFGLTPQHLSLDTVQNLDAVQNLDTVQRGELPGLEPSTPIYLVCERGQVSELAGLYLEAAGFTAVYHLAGGTRAWPD